MACEEASSNPNTFSQNVGVGVGEDLLDPRFSMCLNALMKQPAVRAANVIFHGLTENQIIYAVHKHFKATGVFPDADMLVTNIQEAEEKNAWPSRAFVCQGFLQFLESIVTKESLENVVKDSQKPTSKGDSGKFKTEIETLKSQVLATRDERMCKVCTDTEADMLTLPCAHLVTCRGCVERLVTCPICRSFIKAVVKVFRS